MKTFQGFCLGLGVGLLLLIGCLQYITELQKQGIAEAAKEEQTLVGDDGTVYTKICILDGLFAVSTVDGENITLHYFNCQGDPETYILYPNRQWKYDPFQKKFIERKVRQQ